MARYSIGFLIGNELKRYAADDLFVQICPDGDRVTIIFQDGERPAVIKIRAEPIEVIYHETTHTIETFAREKFLSRDDGMADCEKPTKT